MSAFVVSRAHIDLLVSALIQQSIVTESEADKVGAILWRENHKSVNALYNDKTRTPLYRHSEHTENSAAALVKSIDCFEYQTCEHAGWRLSTTRAWMLALRGRIGCIVPVPELRTTPEYEAAPWGVA